MGVSFNEGLTITGTPRVALTVGSATRYATMTTYTDFGTTTFAIFSYTVQGGDSDTDGVSIPANGLELNGATIQDADDTDADLVHTASGGRHEPQGGRRAGDGHLGRELRRGGRQRRFGDRQRHGDAGRRHVRGGLFRHDGGGGVGAQRAHGHDGGADADQRHGGDPDLDRQRGRPRRQRQRHRPDGHVHGQRLRHRDGGGGFGILEVRPRGQLQGCLDHHLGGRLHRGGRQRRFGDRQRDGDAGGRHVRGGLFRHDGGGRVGEQRAHGDGGGADADQRHGGDPDVDRQRGRPREQRRRERPHGDVHRRRVRQGGRGDDLRGHEVRPRGQLHGRLHGDLGGKLRGGGRQRRFGDRQRDGDAVGGHVRQRRRVGQPRVRQQRAHGPDGGADADQRHGGDPDADRQRGFARGQRRRERPHGDVHRRRLRCGVGVDGGRVVQERPRDQLPPSARGHPRRGNRSRSTARGPGAPTTWARRSR